MVYSLLAFEMKQKNLFIFYSLAAFQIFLLHIFFKKKKREDSARLNFIKTYNQFDSDELRNKPDWGAESSDAEFLF